MVEASKEAAAVAARRETAQMHRESMQPFQSMEQQQAAAMSQILAVQQQTAQAAAEMRESNRDQRAFMRANDEQMTHLATLIGQHYGLSQQNMQEGVAQILGMPVSYTHLTLPTISRV